MTISRAQMNKQIQNSTKIKKFNAGGLVSYNGCGAIAPGKRKFTKIG